MTEEAGMIRIAIGTLALMMLAVPVCANLGGETPVRHVPDVTVSQPLPVSQDEVLAMARAQGLAKLSDIAFEGGVWSIEGASKSGVPMIVQVTSTGELVTHTS